MEYRSLGRTGVQVSAACLGTMTFGWQPDDWGSTESEGEKVGRHALDIGINFIDTADVYNRGGVEKVVAKIIRGKRDRLVIATKCHGKMSDDDPNAWGNSRRHIVEACHASLQRLETDYIDLYQLHRPQPAIPIDESLRAIDDLIRAGKIRYAGTSTYAGWQLCEAHYVAKQLGTNTFISEQPPYNLLDRRIEHDLLPFCRTYDYAVIPWSPLAGGMLSGKYLEHQPKEGRYAKSDPMGRLKQIPVQKLRRFKRLAEQNGMSMTTLSLAWVANQPGITAPIIGAKSAKQLEESANACTMKLSAKVLKKIDEIFPPGLHYVDYYTADFGPNVRPV